MKIDHRAFRDHWDFFDAVTFLRGYPQGVPKILVSHGLGSLFAAHLCAQRPGFFKASISISPWLCTAEKPNFFSLGMMKAKRFTTKGFERHWPSGKYLPEKLIEQISPKDRLWLDDSLTVNSYLNLLELMDQL
jgi:pimeloyl-ACP methyl ester carboxylesterase